MTPGNFYKRVKSEKRILLCYYLVSNYYFVAKCGPVYYTLASFLSFSVRMASQVESSSIGRQSKSEQRLEASLTKALEKIKQLESENESLRKQFTVAGETSAVGCTEEAWKMEREQDNEREVR